MLVRKLLLMMMMGICVSERDMKFVSLKTIRELLCFEVKIKKESS